MQHLFNDIVAISATLGWMYYGEKEIKMFNFLSFKKSAIPPIEKWANHNSKKASADDLIAGAIVGSFAEHFKHWKFCGDFNQRYDGSGGFKPTSLSRKMVGKKHVEVVFVFRATQSGDAYSTIYKYKVIGCEVNGIRISDRAFQHIYTSWNNVVVKVKAAEEVAEKAKNEMVANELRWDLAESLLGMKRNGLGVLIPVKTVEEA